METTSLLSLVTVNESVAYTTMIGNDSLLIVYSTTPPEDVGTLVRSILGEKRKDILSVILLTAVYTLIFITGVVGNMSTCLVIWKNPYMHTVTNYYLFNLAVSDVITLMLGNACS